jgi:hypothetical protein
MALAAESEGLLDIKFGLHYTLYRKDANGFSTPNGSSFLKSVYSLSG